MKRIILLLIFAGFLAISGFAIPEVPDSLTVTWMKGKRYLVHKVEQDDNWDLISKKYSIPLGTLRDENREIRELKINQFVFVPIHEKSGDRENVKVRSVAGGKQVESQSGDVEKIHIVQKGENLYRISLLYKKSVEELVRMNGLSSHAVSVGQKLKVGQEETEPVETASLTEVRNETPRQLSPEELEKKQMILKEKENEEIAGDSIFESIISDSILKTAENPFQGIKATHEVEDVKKVSGGKKVSQIKETGVATFILDEDLDQKKFYALHRTAPIGTIVKVLNIMTNQSVFVKVVGRLPDTGDNNNLVIKLSESAAREILTRDPYFRVVLTYGEIQ